MHPLKETRENRLWQRKQEVAEDKAPGLRELELKLQLRLEPEIEANEMGQLRPHELKTEKLRLGEKGKEVKRLIRVSPHFICCG